MKDGISGMSHRVGSVTLSNGAVLRGTADHKVFVKRKGLVELQNLIVGDILQDKNILLCPKRSSCIKGLDTLGIRVETIITRMERISRTEFLPYIGKLGLTILEQFLKGCVFTIRIMMWIIMRFPILNFWIERFIPNITLTKEKNPSKQNLPNGEAVLKDGKPYKKTQERCVKGHQKEDSRAMIVERMLRRNAQHNFVASLVGKSIKGVKKLFVIFAQRSFIKSQECDKEKLVRIDAVGNFDESEVVYNLTVGRAHLYYANGFLVTNTTGNDHALDSVRYFFLTLKGQSSASETKNEESLPAWWKKLQKDKQRRKMLLESAL